MQALIGKAILIVFFGVSCSDTCFQIQRQFRQFIIDESTMTTVTTKTELLNTAQTCLILDETACPRARRKRSALINEDFDGDSSVDIEISRVKRFSVPSAPEIFGGRYFSGQLGKQTRGRTFPGLYLATETARSVSISTVTSTIYTETSSLPVVGCPMLFPRCPYTGCPEGWTLNPMTDFCFKVTDASQDWAASLAICEGEGGNLASILSADEQTFIETYLAGLSIASDVWFGGNDMATEGTNVWSDGSAWGYTNWNSGQPGGGSSENCFLISGGLSYNWSDRTCAATMPALCAKRR